MTLNTGLKQATWANPARRCDGYQFTGQRVGRLRIDSTAHSALFRAAGGWFDCLADTHEETMIPQVQSRVGKNGRCFMACLASILEIPESAVPDFPKDDAGFDRATQQFLAGYGLRYDQVPIASNPAPIGYHTIEGISPRGGMHATVGYNGKMVWDPHPQDGTGRGLRKPMFYGILTQRGAKDALPPKPGEKITLPNGKRTTVTKVLKATNLFGEPEYHVSTTTGEVLPVPIKENE